MTATTAPIIKSFRILGLHGYKDVNLQFDSNCKIIIAENGTGKTTILSALQAFLDGQFERLENIQFESIECEVAGSLLPLVLQKSMVETLDPKTSDRLQALAQWTDYDEQVIRRAIIDLPSVSPEHIESVEIFQEIYQRSPWDWDDVTGLVSGIRQEFAQDQSAELKALARQVKEALAGAEILYLPTYRRVELPLTRNERKLRRETRPRNRPLSALKSTWEKLGIQFGLADVEHRLATLFTDIQRRSNMGYRSISANIIDELLAGLRARGSAEDTHLPDIDALQRFLSRVATSSPSQATAIPTKPDKRFKAIQDLYDSGQINNSDNQELRYFLSKLSSVVDETREVESNIEEFVAKANVYLQDSSDQKSLEYDSQNMSVVVRSKWTNTEIKLDELSSGEKQVISLLAHLYLDSRSRIVLIDEPELSLSIDWQKRLLPDVLGAPRCRQLLAITHSPFIFDNELDPFAGPLDVSRRKR